MGTNMSFIPGLDPELVSHASVLVVLGTGFLAGLGALVAVIGIVTRRRRLAAASALGGTAVVVGYCAVLLALSLASRERTLARGEEKYFCGPDCHLAYSVVDVRVPPAGVKAREPATAGLRYQITLRIRFDETTTAPWRPKDATLAPERRAFSLVDRDGREYPATRISTEDAADAGEAALVRPLRPGESHRVRLEFDVPGEARDLRLLVEDAAWDYRLTVAHENSLLHKKTFLGL